eukprot:3730867-Amphidinium_carterae.1
MARSNYSEPLNDSPERLKVSNHTISPHSSVPGKHRAKDQMSVAPITHSTDLLAHQIFCVCVTYGFSIDQATPVSTAAPLGRTFHITLGCPDSAVNKYALDTSHNAAFVNTPLSGHHKMDAKANLSVHRSGRSRGRRRNLRWIKLSVAIAGLCAPSVCSAQQTAPRQCRTRRFLKAALHPPSPQICANPQYPFIPTADMSFGPWGDRRITHQVHASMCRSIVEIANLLQWLTLMSNPEELFVCADSSDWENAS